MGCARQGFADLDHSNQQRIHWMVTVSSIETVITIRPGSEKTKGSELTQFVLNGVQGEAGRLHQFADVMLFRRIGKE